MSNDSARAQELHQKIQELEKIFSARLPERVNEIGTALQQCEADPDNRELLATLHRLMHTLAGSAGTFGFDMLGIHARNFEDQINVLMNSETIPAEVFSLVSTDLKAFLRWMEVDPKGNGSREAENLHEHASWDMLEQQPMESTDRKIENEINNPSAELPSEVKPIFIVDDDVLFTKDLAIQFDYFGYEIVIINKLEMLEAAVQERSPSVIIMDMVFGSGKCAGAAEMMRIEKLNGRHIPAIFISAQGDFDTRLAAVRAGADDFFQKPLNIVELCDRIDSLISGKEVMPYRVLIVDDDELSGEYYRMTLSAENFDVMLISKPSEILRALSEHKPELVLMDVYMPECNGVELAKLIRQDNRFHEVPIVFLSTESNVVKQLDALTTGADDFLAKPIEPLQLIASLTSRIERYRTLRSLITRDSLTGLYNHLAIKDFLMREVSRANRSDASLAVAMIDIDDIKVINDQYGHYAGDQVVKVLSRLLQQRLRRGDIVGHYSGEKITVIFPNTTSENAASVLDHVREVFSRIRHRVGNNQFRVSFSVGVADRVAHKDEEMLLRAADKALYLSRENGSNCVEIAK